MNAELNEDENRMDSSRDGNRVENMMNSQQGDGGAMSLRDYQRMRRGYERAIAPEALEQINAQEPVEDSATVQTSRRVIRITPETHIPAGYSYAPEPEPRVRRGGRIGPIAVLLIFVVGIVGALALYAGGADFIAGLFGGEEEEPAENLTLVTERPGADQTEFAESLVPAELVENGEDEEREAEVAPEPEEDIAAAERETEAAAARERAAREEASRREESIATPAEVTTEKPTPPAESTGEVAPAKSVVTPPVVEKPAAKPTGTYMAQVGATPDRSEADRIATSLRSRGGENISISTATVDGATIYRVRYGSFSSEDEARQKSGALGYGNVWVVKK